MSNASRGHLLVLKPKSRGTAFGAFYFLYVDDGAMLFNSREDLIWGVNLIYRHFKRFSLEMPFSRRGKESKTEAVHIYQGLYSTAEDKKIFIIADGFVTFIHLQISWTHPELKLQ